MARRRSNRPGLLWALLISLLINHGLVLPGAYLLLMARANDPLPDPVMEVALVPQEELPPEIEPPRQPDRTIERRRQPVTRKPRPEEKKTEPKKPEPKRPEKKKAEQPRPRSVEPLPREMRLKMVEVNNPETDLPPKNARFLSDKNRRVEQETRARHTNLVKDHPRPEPLSTPNPRTEPKPGSKKHRVAEQREQRSKQRKREQLRKQRKVSPLLVMRPQLPPQPARAERKKLAERAPDGDLPQRQEARPEQKRAPRVQLQLDHRSLDRIDGEAARKQRELARLSPSTPRGRHDRKWQRIKSALENFIPEVRPGNQTALGTRANPFALYIARMHRGIHKLWGYGFLVDLDNKADGHPMNDMRLWTMIEIVVKPGGEVEKATIVKTSGILPFDVAALDTVFSASPYPPTPRAIRSADGKVYLHWRFHRDQRQCGTFGVDPFILTTPPKGPIDGDMSEVGRGGGEPRRMRRLNRPRAAGGSVATAPRSTAGGAPHRHGGGKVRARVAPPAAPERSKAREAARRFAEAFRRGDAAAMARASALPFLAHGKKIATSRGELARMFGDLIRESRGGPARIGAPMTVMQARKALGRLPAGAEYGSGMLVSRATLGGRPATVLLRADSHGTWRVFGLNR